MLADKDRIFTNLYGFQDWGLKAAQQRGDWDDTKALLGRGQDAIIDELYIRPPVRGRGIASETLIALPRALAQGGLQAIHLEVDRDNAAAVKLYTKAGFKARDRYMFMSRAL